MYGAIVSRAESFRLSGFYALPRAAIVIAFWRILSRYTRGLSVAQRKKDCKFEGREGGRGWEI